MKQLTLSQEMKIRKTHGGSLATGRRKEYRPIVTKRPMHVTFRSSLARGRLSLFPHRKFIEIQLKRVGKMMGVKIYEVGIAGNHVHLVVLAKTRGGFQGFLRVFAGLVARKVTGAKKGKPFGKRFWDWTAWSRILEWGRDFQRALSYVLQNQLEGLGLIPYQARGHPPARSISQRF